MPHVEQRIRVESISMARRGVLRDDKTALKFLISEDLIFELLRMHDTLYKVYFFDRTPKADRYKKHRIEFARLLDMGIPAVLMRIEPPSYDPHGAKFTRYGRQYTLQIAARKLRVKPGIARQNLSFYLAEEMRGIMVNFAESDMVPPADVELAKGEKPIPRNDQDMAVYRQEHGK